MITATRRRQRRLASPPLPLLQPANPSDPTLRRRLTVEEQNVGLDTLGVEMVRGMKPGSLIVDLAAERGGNCEFTKADETVCENGVTILGPSNLSSTIPVHASEMYSRNIMTFLLAMVHDGQLKIDLDDEVVCDTLVTYGGEVVNSHVRQLLGMDPVEEQPAEAGQPPAAPAEITESAQEAESKDEGAGVPEESKSAEGIEN